MKAHLSQEVSHASPTFSKQRDNITRVSDRKAVMEKRQIIEAIRQYNPSADEEFLNRFKESQLKEYLDHLDAARRKELLIAGWVRPRPRLRIAS